MAWALIPRRKLRLAPQAAPSTRWWTTLPPLRTSRRGWRVGRRGAPPRRLPVSGGQGPGLLALPRLDPDAEELVARNDLAVTIAGDAHGLDDGTPLASAVLRGIAPARDTAVPTTVTGRRGLWHDAGVVTDQVSTTVLTLGLRPLGNGRREPSSSRAARAESGR